VIKKIFVYYKLPLLISATLTITLLALGVIRNPISITEVIVGCFLGTFILDLEYVMYAYILEPNAEFSKSVFGYIKSKDFGGLIGFVNTHKDEVKDKSLNSALFQAILVPIAIFAVYASQSLVIKALILSTLANSIYKLIESFFEGTSAQWFWAIKMKPTKTGVTGFIVVLVLVLIYCLYVF
jgi:hypothetical protein